MYNVVLLYIYLHVYVIWYKIKMETGKKKKKKKKRVIFNSNDLSTVISRTVSGSNPAKVQQYV